MIRTFVGVNLLLTLGSAFGQPTQTTSQLTMRRIWTDRGHREGPGQISRDGRYFTYFSAEGDLALLEIATGARRTIAPRKPGENSDGVQNS